MFDNCPTIELIDRAAILKGRPFQVAGGPIDAYTEGFCDCAEEARAAVESAPIVDAEPVIRCWQCKKFKPVGGMSGYCYKWDTATLRGDYCSYGERKEAVNEVSRS